MKIKCANSEILEINNPKIIPNPENPNDHSPEQIMQYAKVLNYQGQRKPIIISNKSGFIVTGHGMLLAAKELGAKKVAVDFQDFDNEAMEYAHVVADNGLAMQAELDKARINSRIPDFGPDFDIDYLGLKDFKIDFSEVSLPALPSEDKSELEQITFTVHIEQRNYIDAAIEKANKMAPYSDELNSNKNGNAISRICEIFLNNDLA